MKIKILQKYIEICKENQHIPTFKGLKRYNKCLKILKGE